MLTVVARADESDDETGNEDEDDADLVQTSHILQVSLPVEDSTNGQASNIPRAPSLSRAQPVQPLTEDYIIESFPGDKAGAPLQCDVHQSNFEKYQQHLNSKAEYAPFTSWIDWEIARWAKIHGPSSAAVTELLKISGVSLSFCRFSESTITQVYR